MAESETGRRVFFRPAASVCDVGMSKRRLKSVRFVSRGGDKLDSALDHFGIDVQDAIAADLGANVGGFTDCLLQRGARRVFAVETGYGVLDWKLRQDTRVVVMERQNALYVTLDTVCDIVVADVGWTPLSKVVPRALSLLSEGGCCVALLKAQYEAPRGRLKDGHIDEAFTEEIVRHVVEGLREFGRVDAVMEPEVERGGRNPERFVLMTRGR